MNSHTFAWYRAGRRGVGRKNEMTPRHTNTHSICPGTPAHTGTGVKGGGLGVWAPCLGLDRLLQTQAVGSGSTFFPSFNLASSVQRLGSEMYTPGCPLPAPLLLPPAGGPIGPPPSTGPRLPLGSGSPLLLFPLFLPKQRGLYAARRGCQADSSLAQVQKSISPSFTRFINRLRFLRALSGAQQH